MALPCGTTGSLCSSFLPDRLVGLPVKRACAITLCVRLPIGLSDDDNFSYCLWDTDPLYRNDREKYIFDYRLGENSPAIGAGYVHAVDPRAAVDAYGNERGSEPDLGAYVYVPQQAGTAD